MHMMCLMLTGATEGLKSHNAVLYDASWYPQPKVRCQDSSYSPREILSTPERYLHNPAC